MRRISLLVALLVAAPLAAACGVGPCPKERYCRSVDAIPLCKDAPCDTSAGVRTTCNRGGQFCAPLGFDGADGPQFLRFPFAQLRDRLGEYTVVKITQIAGSPITGTPGTIELRYPGGPAFGLYFEFSESTCTQTREVCGM